VDTEFVLFADGFSIVTGCISKQGVYGASLPTCSTKWPVTKSLCFLEIIFFLKQKVSCHTKLVQFAVSTSYPGLEFLIQ
jgi:hypothetical protein